MHGLHRVIGAFEAGEARVIGEPIEVDPDWLGPVCGGEPWSPGEVAWVIGGAQDGLSGGEIAKLLDRSIEEIHAKAAELGVMPGRMIN